MLHCDITTEHCTTTTPYLTTITKPQPPPPPSPAQNPAQVLGYDEPVQGGVDREANQQPPSPEQPEGDQDGDLKNRELSESVRPS